MRLLEAHHSSKKIGVRTYLLTSRFSHLGNIRPYMMSTCICQEAIQRSFATVGDALHGAHDMDVIIAGSEMIARSNEKWMRLYR
jgi:hypothetical protein